MKRILATMIEWGIHSTPLFLRPALRPVYQWVTRVHFVRRIVWGKSSAERSHAYWRNPMDVGNKPLGYLYDGMESSLFLLNIIKRYAKAEAQILEIGCNVGRNLHVLYDAGFRNLAGIEISGNAVEMLRLKFPDMAQDMALHNDAVENVIRVIPDAKYNIVFTMAVLEHLHDDSSWVFGEMVRITRNVLITIEDEVAVSWRTFPRNYQKVFESMGMEQLECHACSKLPSLSGSFKARVFKHVGK